MRKWLMAIVFGSFVGVGAGFGVGLAVLASGNISSIADWLPISSAAPLAPWWPWRGDSGCNTERLVTVNSRLEPKDYGVWVAYSIRNNCNQPVWLSLSVHGGETDAHRWRTLAFTEPIEVGANQESSTGGQAVAFTSGSGLSGPSVPIPPIEKLFVTNSSAVKPREPLKCRSDSKVTHDLYWDTSATPEGTQLVAEGRITNTCDQAVWSFLEVVAIGNNGVAIGSGFSDGYLIKPSDSEILSRVVERAMIRQPSEPPRWRCRARA